MSGPTDQEIRERLDAVLRWSRERSFAGHSKHDALNSPFLNACSLNVAFLRLVITQVVMRFPVNIRPLLGVPRLRNPKGIGLFAHAYFDRAETATSDDERTRHIVEGEELIAWLVRNASPQAPGSADVQNAFGGRELQGAVKPGDERRGLGWGYHYPWQDQGFFQPRHYPNRVVTSWIGFAVLRAYALTRDVRYLDVCREIAEFLLENPRVLHEDEHQLCLSYVPLDDIEWAVMDVSALTASFVAQYAAAIEGSGQDLKEKARRLMAFVVDKQTDYGAWFYTWPAKDSHIQHDNYHTAIILDCLADYMTATGDREWEDVYRRGLDYYQSALFRPSGAPCWMNDKEYPYDIHGAASGILAFTRAADYWKRSASVPDEDLASGCLEQADRILSWTLDNLSDPRGFFYYQKTKWFTKRFCLMRWGNGWMSRALAQRLRLG